MKKVLICVLLLVYITSALCKDYEFILERLEVIPGDENTLVDYNELSLRKQPNGEYLGNGNLTYHEDLHNDVMHTVKTSYSTTGSSLYHNHPYTIQKSTACEFFKTFYRKYGQPWIEEHTDFPHITEEGLCPMPKGTYFIKDLRLDTSKFPEHAPKGFWRLDQIFEKGGKCIGGLRIIGKCV